MIEREELIKIGRFNKPHGVKGELSFTFTDEQVGIIKVTMDGAAENGNGDAPVYDLSGQRVLKTVPGNVYVSKGRKFIAK